MAKWYTTCHKCGKGQQIVIDSVESNDAREAYKKEGWQVGGNGRHWLCPDHNPKNME